MSEEIKKTSKDWYDKLQREKGLIIYDPDGWDRKNYDFSFYEELITFDEFNERLMRSTSIFMKNRNIKA